MNGEIVYASLVCSTGFEQIYCRPNLSYMYLPRARSAKFLNKYLLAPITTDRMVHLFFLGGGGGGGRIRSGGSGWL